jgi:hypothetical protein
LPIFEERRALARLHEFSTIIAMVKELRADSLFQQAPLYPPITATP